jgi:hypothetical protein
MATGEIKLNGSTFYQKVQKLIQTWNKVILRLRPQVTQDGDRDGWTAISGGGHPHFEFASNTYARTFSWTLTSKDY